MNDVHTLVKSQWMVRAAQFPEHITVAVVPSAVADGEMEVVIVGGQPPHRMVAPGVRL